MPEQRVNILFTRTADTTRYIRPDDYAVQLTIEGDNAKPLTYEQPLHVKYPSWLIMQKWNDVLAILNDRYNGGYRFSAIQWYRSGTAIPARGEHSSYIYEGSEDNRKTLLFGSPYWAELTRSGETKGICTCEYVPERTENGRTVFAPQVELTSQRGTIQITANKTGRYTLYDILGRILTTGTISHTQQPTETGIKTQVGTYICVFTADDSTETVQKFVIQ